MRFQLSFTLAQIVFAASGILYAAPPIEFEDVSASSGLNSILENVDGKRPWRYAHGAAWGDVDGDGRPDLYVGAFAARKWFEGAEAPVPNRLLLNRGGKFVSADEEVLQFGDAQSRCAGALFVDLDEDGDLDLVVTNHAQNANHGGSRLFENLGRARFRDVTPVGAPWTGGLGIRNVAAVDFNRDGKLDLVLADGSYGKQGEAKAKLFVLENKGTFQFADASEQLGFPHMESTGLGLAVGDVNNDGTPDVFVAGSNRLFVSDGPRFREAHPGRFRMTPADAREGLHCGAAFGDLNQDGLLDLVTTEHGVPARIHVFHNRGVTDGVPDLVEVSEASGVGELFPRGTRAQPIKTAHVALRDMDNDGRPDIVLTVITRGDDGRIQPVVLRNLSARGGELKFTTPPFDKMVGYYAPGPVADFDRDGRLDIFLPSWFEELPSSLFRNVTAGGHWMTVRVTGRGPGRNGMGVGAVVWAYAAGHLGDPKHLIGRADIAIGTGYASGEEALAHLGLGESTKCDLRVTWSGHKMDRTGIAADQLLTVVFGGDDQPAAGKKQGRRAVGVSPPSSSGASQPSLAKRITYPPELPAGKPFVTIKSDELLSPPATLLAGVAVAREAPTVDFLYYPGQTYEGKPWSNWGDSSFAKGKYYSAIGDHLAPQGNAFVFEYDPVEKRLRQVAEVRKTIRLPDDHYRPGKIHSHVQLGDDGWLYFSTHRGSTKATTDANHYLGDWILRANPTTGAAEVVACGPVPKHCIPNGLLDSQRLMFYGGTAPGSGGDNAGIQFFAYDLRARKVLYSGPDGPSRAMILASSTGRVYYTPGLADEPLMRYDPAAGGPPKKIAGTIGIRAATQETPQHLVYTVSIGRQGAAATLYSIDTQTEVIESLGPAAVGVNQYVASLAVDPTGRYVYYVPGAHGGSEQDNSAVVQFDTQTRRRKVIAFLHPHFEKQFGCVPKGTYAVAIDDRGESLYITWNISRGSRAWDCCGLTVIHIPESERRTED